MGCIYQLAILAFLELCQGVVDRTASCLFREERLVLSQIFPHLVIIHLLVLEDFHGPHTGFNKYSFMVTNSRYYFTFIEKWPTLVRKMSR